ncbi:MAG TPA: DUF763 domain-containing protein [Candidatus Aenigmarchaeota archaeon]|nr:DUF763 domain-containing protein [Candidatus Aenigmarchaeota archaeon]
MKRTGISDLPLHYGRCPRWLFVRMKGMLKSISKIIILEYGKDEFLKRLSNPFFFQSLGCVVGWDWHSSGLTTTLTGALKEVLKEENIGVVIAGGKGKTSLKTPKEIQELANKLSLSSTKEKKLIYASKMSAKVDNAVLQDGFTLYHHTIIFDERGRWVVIQQGMNTEKRYARRYHWLSNNVKSFVEEPHTAVVSDIKQKVVLDMTSKKSKEAQKICVDLVNDNPKHIYHDLLLLRSGPQKTIPHFFKKRKVEKIDYLKMPWNVNWKVLKKAYEIQPRNYEELVKIKGLGPSTIRGLAYVANLIYGKPISWKDPAKFSFAYGGKDGVPRPVDRKAMDESIKFLKEILEKTEIERKRRLNILKKLEKFVPA